jgi:hypothetical protein
MSACEMPKKISRDRGIGQKLALRTKREQSQPIVNPQTVFGCSVSVIAD